MFSIGKTQEQKAEAEVERRRADPKTYTEPLDYSSDPKMKEFLMDFYKNVLFKKQDEMKALLDEHPKTIGKFYKQLVPSQMENEDFWQRYYYRVKSVDGILKEWGVGGDTGLTEEEAPPSPKKDRTFSTMELLHQAEQRVENKPVMGGASLLDESGESAIEEEGDDTFEDASETLPDNLGEGGKDDKKSSSSSRSSKDADRRAKKSRSDGSRGDNDSGDDSDGGGSVKSAYSYRSTRSARSSKDRGLSPAREVRRQRSRRRFEDKKKRRDKSPKKTKDWGSMSSPNMDLGRSGSSESFKARRAGMLKPKDDNDDRSVGSMGSKSGSFRVRRQGHVLHSLEDDHADGLKAVQKKASQKWGERKDSKKNLKAEAEKTSKEAESKPEEPLLVSFPGRPSFQPPAKQENEKENPLDRSFFGKVAAMYDPKDPENFSKEDMHASLGLIKHKEEPIVLVKPTAQSRNSGWRTKNSNPYSRRRYGQSEEHEQRCWDICYCLMLTLTLVLIGFSIYLLVKPDQAIIMGDNMCSPIAPYQTLTTDKGKIGVAPWWVWPPKNKEFMFSVLCGDERIRTMLVWAPKHKHEKDFRLVIGDVNEEETILRLNRLDKVEVNGNELKITQDKDAVKDGEPKLPKVIPAAWMKEWDMEDEEITGVESEERNLISS